MRLLNELINKIDLSQIKNIFLREAYSLYKKREDSISLINNINFSVKDIMQIILETINIVSKDSFEKK